MAWRIDSDEDNVTSSTGHSNGEPSNGLPNMNAQGAVGVNLSDQGEHRLLNPYLSRIRDGRRFSTGDINQSNAQRASGSDESNIGQMHSLPWVRNRCRCSSDTNQSNDQQAFGSNEINIRQRHSVPCCHIVPNVLHSCLHLQRRLSLDSLNLRRRNSYPQRSIYDSTFVYPVTRTVLNPYGQFAANENQTASGFGIHNEYERQNSFSISHSLLFGNENFQIDRYVQQAVYSAGPEFFMRFLAGEMDRQGLQIPEDMCRDTWQSAEMPQSFMYLIEIFSASLEREMIFCLALRVQFPLTLSSFVAIVDGMNNGTPERIVTLFFFCADLATRALREGNATLFYEIVSWTRWYFQRCGSLVVVPSKRSSFKIFATCLLGIIAVLFLMKRNQNN